ncbi:MAG: ethylbenzene dehydrogenase-related protein [Candidatus Zixiibacteriota bacterium]
MSKLFMVSIFSLLLIFAGCSEDSGSGNDPDPVTPPARLVVDTLASPAFSGVDEAVWSTLADSATAYIEIGGSALYGRNSTLGTDTVVIQAIVKGGMIYIRAKWHDGTQNDMGGYIEFRNSNWSRETYHGDDKFMIIFGKAQSTQKADCAAMCHVTYHKADVDTVDFWSWSSTKTAPGKMSDDGYWNSVYDSYDNESSVVNKYVWRRNWNAGNAYPYWMPATNPTTFTGEVLYLTEVQDFDAFLSWPDQDSLPGYAIDTSIFNLSPAGNQWDVKALSEYEVSGVSTLLNTWTVVFKRPLNTGYATDIDLSTLDSIQIAIAATTNDFTGMFTGATIVPHSGSKPFWLILKP